jgi:hypothetical protein
MDAVASGGEQDSRGEDRRSGLIVVKAKLGRIGEALGVHQITSKEKRP